MKILIHGINFWPELTGIGKYSGEMVEWLASRGHDVRVVTAPPYYPKWKVYSGYSALRYSRMRSASHGPTVYRCPIWVPRRASGLSRLIHLASFALSSLPVMLGQVFWRPDIVLVVAPTFFCAPHAWLTARLSGAKAWLHIQDFEIDAAYALGILRNETLRTLVSAIERLIMRRFDRVSTISHRMLERLAVKGIDVRRQVLFPNWVDTHCIYPLDAASPFRIQISLPAEGIVVLYSGNMGEKQGLDVLLEATQLLVGRRHIHFVLCGDGVAKERLKQKYPNLANVTWLDLQPVPQLNNLLNAADIHVLPQRADAADLIMPSKLTGMMASGSAIVAAALPGTQIAQALEGCGKIVQPGDAAALAAGIEALASDADLRDQLGRAARKRAVETLSHDAILGQFEKDLKTCMLNR